MPVLSRDLVGTWELVSRHTQPAAGGPITPRPDTVLGMVVYDAGGNFSAQFMDRSEPSGDSRASGGTNNTRSVAGYDAYFGRYTVNDAAGTVTQTIRGSLARENVGAVLTRAMQVVNDELTISLETTGPDSKPEIFTLIWKRVG